MRFHRLALAFLLGARLSAQAPLSTFDYRASLPLDVQVASTTRSGGYDLIDLTYASPAGGRVPAFLYVPAGKGPFPALIAQHGLPGSRNSVSRTANAFASAGVVVLAITAPFGRPDASAREGPITLTPRDSAEQVQLIQDLRRGVDLLASRPDVDPKRIGYIGYSYGGAMGGLVVAAESRLVAAVLAVGDGGLVTHFTGPEDENGPLASMPAPARDAWLNAMRPIEPIRFIGRSRVPLLLQSGRQDQLVPPADAERYQAAAGEPKTIKWYDAGHGLTAEASADAARWLARYLRFDVTQFQAVAR
jgi:uncharacterized protein